MNKFFHLASSEITILVLPLILKPRSLSFISSSPIHELNYTCRAYTYLHICRPTALSFLFLIARRSHRSPMLPTTTIPVFPYRSLPLQPGGYTLLCLCSRHPPPTHASYLSSSLPTQILSPLKLLITVVPRFSNISVDEHFGLQTP